MSEGGGIGYVAIGLCVWMGYYIDQLLSCRQCQVFLCIISYCSGQEKKTHKETQTKLKAMYATCMFVDVSNEQSTVMIL